MCCPIRKNQNEENNNPPNHRLKLTGSPRLSFEHPQLCLRVEHKSPTQKVNILKAVLEVT